MKIHFLYIILSITLISNYGYSQHSEKKIKSIQDSIQIELNDTLKSKWVKPELDRMIELLNSPDSLFPYLEFDSVSYFRYGTEDRFEPTEWNQIYMEHILDFRTLSIEEVNSILIVVNNPLNFEWGECGTPFIEGAIIFYNGGIEIAKIEHACSGGQVFSTPQNPLIRWGNLNEKGYKKLFKIIN